MWVVAARSAVLSVITGGGSSAPLSSGLEIVRKVLGQHEIASVQTTSIDLAAGIINLSTVLAHASGEWIASEWPVCAVRETATPHRMGAALTARRYALFTLVGIAGEDDLDAPDLPTPSAKPSDRQKPTQGGNGHLNSGGNKLGQATTARAVGMNSSPNPVLAPEASEQLRDRLIAEIADLTNSDDAALWVHRSLGEKNKLIASDADCVERAFAAKLKALGEATQGIFESSNQPVVRLRRAKKKTRSKRINKSLLQLPEARRIRDREHVKFVAQHPCLICGRRPADGHHLRFVQNRAMARARLVMNSLFRSVAVTIARSTDAGTKLDGEEVRESIRLLRLAHCGSKVTRYRKFRCKPEGKRGT
jgi:hypothetical protein